MKRKSLGERGITLVALVVTIIILLILAAITISLVLGQGGLLQRAKDSGNVYQRAEVNESQELDEYGQYLGNVAKEAGVDAGDNSGSGSGSGSDSGNNSDNTKGNSNGKGGGITAGSSSDYQSSNTSTSEYYDLSYKPITKTGLLYADMDGDGTADGMIVSDSEGNAVTKEKIDNGDYAGYSEKEYTLINLDASTVSGYLVTSTNSSDKFYVLALTDFDQKLHYWYKKAGDKISDYTFTSTGFGTGKENTAKMVDRINNHADTTKYSIDYGEATTETTKVNNWGEVGPDMWYVIQDKVKEGWFVPSKGEWESFITNMGSDVGTAITCFNSGKGWSVFTWSSSMAYVYGPIVCVYNGSESFSSYPTCAGMIRLCCTF